MAHPVSFEAPDQIKTSLQTLTACLLALYHHSRIFLPESSNITEIKRMHTCLHFLWSTLRCWEAHHRQPLTPPVSTLTSWSLQICERQLMPRLLKCQSCFWVPLSAFQVKTILCWRNFIGVQTLKKVRGRFSYVLVEMDQKWMTSTDWSTKNSLPNLAIYLWGTEEAATFKMHFGPYFCSMLQGFFYLQLEAE